MGCAYSTEESNNNNQNSIISESNGDTRRKQSRVINQWALKDVDCLKKEDAKVTIITDEKKQTVQPFILNRKSHLVNPNYTTLHRPNKRPKVQKGELWTDPDFPPEVALRGLERARDIEWKRLAIDNILVSENHEVPCLFSKDTTRFDVHQGSIGDCWFVSVLAGIAEKKAALKKIIPNDSYKIGKSSYDGIFHCRFWKDGTWEDVYIDDCLPIKDGNRLFGARSTTNPNELWVPLIEKAFAKLYGGYSSIIGGSCGDAFTHLTGGVSNKVETRNTEDFVLFCKIKNAILSGSVVTTSVSEAPHGRQTPTFHGLITDHAYTVTGASQIPYDGEMLQLIRLRNPWGNEQGKWKGPWSGGSSEWNKIDPDMKKRLKVKPQDADDGEFWISVKDLKRYFDETYICDFTPKHGKNWLDKFSTIVGEWRGQSAAGSHDFRNPKYRLRITASGSKIPVGIQIIQKRRQRKDKKFASVRMNLYKIVSEGKGDSQYLHLMEITCNDNQYRKYPEVTEYYSLPKGDYVLMPTVMHFGIEKKFRVRIFSVKEVLVSYIDKMPTFFIAQACESKNDKVTTITGEWKGPTAGGVKSVFDKMKNPKYILCVPKIGGGKSSVTVQMMQSLKDKIDKGRGALRADLYKIISQHGSNDEYIHMTELTNMLTYMEDYQVTYKYDLEEGKYLLVPTTMHAGIEKKFHFRISAKKEIRIRNLQNGSFFQSDTKYSFEHRRETMNTNRFITKFHGQWLGSSAGGQISNLTFAKNPQYSLKISGSKQQPVTFSLVQEITNNTIAIGLQIIKVQTPPTGPLDQRKLVDSHEYQIKTVDGNKIPFLKGNCNSGNYYLEPGYYVIVCFTDKPKDEKSFVLSIGSQVQIECRELNEEIIDVTI